jgi:hypothetical protein
MHARMQQALFLTTALVLSMIVQQDGNSKIALSTSGSLHSDLLPSEFKPDANGFVVITPDAESLRSPLSVAYPSLNGSQHAIILSTFSFLEFARVV